MKKLLLFLPLMLLAYQPGEPIEPAILKKLHITTNDLYVIDFFASWCHSCKKELPLIQKLSKKLTIVGVDVDEDEAAGRTFQQKLGLTFPIVNDSKGAIVSRFNPVAIPAIYFVKDKKVIGAIIGARDQIDQIILQKAKELQ